MSTRVLKYFIASYLAAFFSSIGTEEVTDPPTLGSTVSAIPEQLIIIIASMIVFVVVCILLAIVIAVSCAYACRGKRRRPTISGID